MPLLEPRLDGAATVSGGRKLGYAEFGPADGFPVFWFHGTPGARNQVPPLGRAAADDLGLRVIGVERPGIGRSTQHRYRSIAEFAPDIEILADRLGADRFGVVGLSGGGPYTLAVAHRLPERVVAAGVLGGVAPTVGQHAGRGGIVDLTRRFNRPLAAAGAPLGMLLWGVVNGLEPVAGPVYSRFAGLMPEGDRRVFAADGVQEMFVGDLVSGSRRQCRALTNDIVLFGRDWAFDPTAITTPVYWWHGDADPIVRLDHARSLAEKMPTATFEVRPGESHLGGFGIARQVLEAITSHR